MTFKWRICVSTKKLDFLGPLVLLRHWDDVTFCAVQNQIKSIKRESKGEGATLVKGRSERREKSSEKGTRIQNQLQISRI